MTLEIKDSLGARRHFATRHIGPDNRQKDAMLKELGYNDLDRLIQDIVPEDIRMKSNLRLPVASDEAEATAELAAVARKNQIYRSYIGLGYYDTFTPNVIRRNILENPGWYTQYTPYQAEIAQGRLEALLNFQTMVSELTGLEVANASLLDEGTAAAEAMGLSFTSRANDGARVFFVSETCFPQTIDVVRTRAEPLGIEVVVGNHNNMKVDAGVFGVLLQYPASDGQIHDYAGTIKRAKEAGAMVTLAADILSLVLLKSPGQLGADIAIGTTQRFGIPLGFGGPHAGYLATRDEFKRKIPGRIVGVSKDREGRNAIRLALQTREQHIRREKATSNICTAQVLLAVMAGMYAVYHGPEGLKNIAERVHRATGALANALTRAGFKVLNATYFDTLMIDVGANADAFHQRANSKRINLRFVDAHTIGISIDETTSEGDLLDILSVFKEGARLEDLKQANKGSGIPGALRREGAILSHQIFDKYHSETEMMRYIRRLESKDLSLTTSMIPLGSCTMKLNAAAELFPVTWAEFGGIHPAAPADQAGGYHKMFHDLEAWLGEITGFDGVSLQPNSGSQGEYAGLLVVRRYLRGKGEGHRNICLIPQSAHGTNPASAVMAGLQVVVVACDKSGNVDIEDLKKKAAEHSKNLAVFMITYPSTHGVFEEGIRQMCDIIHRHGGQVYMDGANMNAQVGLCRPGEYGPDVCHLNLHKTFCIPHGGGGPGMGPIGVKAHLKPYLPSHALNATDKRKDAVGAISAAPWGSASILPIPWMYIRMLGADGLKQATEIAILNANYIAKRLNPHFPVLYRGKRGLVAHECIVDLRDIKTKTGVDVEDVAKRLMDYGFHAPTVSFPVAGTLMIEPTESESKDELDRFCDAMISIREEIRAIETGKMDAKDNPLKNAPHTAAAVTAEDWARPYSRQAAAFPKAWLKEHKFWPPVARIDNALGDRNLICSCPPIEEY